MFEEVREDVEQSNGKKLLIASAQEWLSEMYSEVLRGRVLPGKTLWSLHPFLLASQEKCHN